MYRYLFVFLLFFWSCEKGNGKVDPKPDVEVEVTDSTANEPTDSIANEPTDSTDVTNPVDTTTNLKHNYYFYIGTYTGSGSNGIYKSVFQSDSGIISTPELVATISNPSFQCISKDHKMLWSVTESGSGSVTGFLIDTITGNLQKTATFSTMGDAPCFVNYHDESKNVITANYNSGNVTKIPVTANGTSNGAAYTHQHTGKSINTSRQAGPHAHCSKVDPTGKYIYSCDLGTDKIYVYTVSGESLDLFKTISATPGSGPRHLDFHPQLKSMAVIHELDGTVTTYLPDADGCFSIENNTVSALPESYGGQKSCADIHYSNDGKFLYGSNRVHNSIALFKIDEITQKATPISWQTSNIKTPRNFAIDPSGKYILVANQDGNNIVVFKIDHQTGELIETGIKQTLSKPVCITFLTIAK